MIEKYKYISKYHRTEETLNARELGHGIYLGINSVVELPFGEIDEQTTSIVIPNDEIPKLIKYLQGVINDDE